MRYASILASISAAFVPWHLARLAALCLLIGLATTPARPQAQVQQEVDLALVLAVDISYSMDPEEQVLQREGFIQAFRSSEVHAAIRRGNLGRIGVTYMEWAGVQEQRVILPWTIIDTPDSALAFAASLSQKPTRRASRTSISGAIDFSAKLLATSEFKASREVVDISGDGPNNSGRPVTVARDELLERGVTINGLPIMLKEGGPFDLPDLDRYYRSCVIGGPGAFQVPVRSREQFVDAVKTKIIMEVAERPLPGIAPPELGGGLVIPAQQQGLTANCLVGETQWRDRMGN